MLYALPALTLSTRIWPADPESLCIARHRVATAIHSPHDLRTRYEHPIMIRTE